MTYTSNLYATDGRCHNSNHGTYNHECGRPAVWLGTSSTGFTCGFCDRCKNEGDERHGKTWEPLETKPRPAKKTRRGHTLRTDPAQVVVPGMGASAVQAQAARDAQGRGALLAHITQKPANEGLFATDNGQEEML